MDRTIEVLEKQLAALQKLLAVSFNPPGYSVNPAIWQELPKLYELLFFLEAFFDDRASGDLQAEYQALKAKQY